MVDRQSVVGYISVPACVVKAPLPAMWHWAQMPAPENKFEVSVGRLCDPSDVAKQKISIIGKMLLFKNENMLVIFYKTSKVCGLIIKDSSALENTEESIFENRFVSYIILH